jgi:hypothetical protein
LQLVKSYFYAALKNPSQKKRLPAHKEHLTSKGKRMSMFAGVSAFLTDQNKDHSSQGPATEVEP